MQCSGHLSTFTGSAPLGKAERCSQKRVQPLKSMSNLTATPKIAISKCTWESCPAPFWGSWSWFSMQLPDPCYGVAPLQGLPRTWKAQKSGIDLDDQPALKKRNRTNPGQCACQKRGSGPPKRIPMHPFLQVRNWNGRCNSWIFRAADPPDPHLVCQNLGVPAQGKRNSWCRCWLRNRSEDQPHHRRNTSSAALKTANHVNHVSLNGGVLKISIFIGISHDKPSSYGGTPMGELENPHDWATMGHPKRTRLPRYP